MDKHQSMTVKFSILMFMLLSPMIVSIALGHVQDDDEEDSIIAKSLYSYWEKAKYLLQEAQKRFLPPPLDFRIQENNAGTKLEDSGERLKDAAKKSFKEGEATLEKTAETAATAMDGAMHKAKDKVEHRASHGHDDEL